MGKKSINEVLEILFLQIFLNSFTLINGFVLTSRGQSFISNKENDATIIHFKIYTKLIFIILLLTDVRKAAGMNFGKLRREGVLLHTMFRPPFRSFFQ